MQPHAAPIQGAGMVLFLAHVQADEHRVIAGVHLPVLLYEPSTCLAAVWRRKPTPTLRRDLTPTPPSTDGPVTISGHPTPQAPATTPPGSCKRQGQTVIPDLATRTPNHRSYEEGNVGWPAGRCSR